MIALSQCLQMQVSSGSRSVCHISVKKRLMIPCRAAPESVLKSDGQVVRAAIALSVGLRWSRGRRHRSFGCPSVQERCSRTSFGSLSFRLLCMCRGPVGGALVSLHKKNWNPARSLPFPLPLQSVPTLSMINRVAAKTSAEQYTLTPA